MRRASVKISIQGKDVSMDLQPYLLTLTYTDKADDELDDLQLTIEDREGLWQGDWLPRHGDVIAVSILAENFRASGTEELDCGEFETDELTLDSRAEGGDVVSIKAVPACAKSSLLLQRKTRAWADAPLSTVAADVVGPAGLDLLYKAPAIVYGRVEQRQEADLAFLQRITKEQGLRVALKSRLCVIYAGQSADALEPLAFRRAELDAADLSLKHSLDGVYTQCVVGYTDAGTSDTTEKSYQPELPPTTGKVLTINKRIEHPAQAERVAKAELRAKNCREMTGRFDGLGDTRLRAGTVLRAEGWGHFDTDYVVQQATHSLSRDGGYRTSAELVKALDY
ncbi:contractile injection system protein, VgrG/Pvc8 family [uncultured Desulfovibrio sp.]|uniref:phage late control D family protein n=1 Tax=uncultured Desulfovibrio sp. TaxID=167968 RepID=UPI002582567F|nr:contractile injection system protein, VgrG/Pvc8 family [uncultured Desulfovibrio sp.]